MNKLPNHLTFSSMGRYDYPLQIKTKTQYNNNFYSQPKSFSQTQKHINDQPLKVLEPLEYSKLQCILNSKLRNLLENIGICKQKNHFKDREVHSNLAQIDKLEAKIKKFEQKTSKREKVLRNISIKCKQMNDSILGEDEKVKKQMVYRHQEEGKCEEMEDQIIQAEKQIRLAQNQLERIQKLTDSLQEKQQEQQRLRETLTKLLNNQKMIEYHAKNQKTQCIELQKKMQSLKKVWKDRTAINKSNLAKLAKLNKQIQNLQVFARNKQNSANQIKMIELQLGQLNQQLLLINQDISQFNFKILRKKQTVAQLRTKNEYSLLQNSTLTNQTPTFPSKELLSEQIPKLQNQEIPNSNQALKNIEKLINRYEMIKSKEEQRY